jgi:hypothetical protein
MPRSLRAFWGRWNSTALVLFAMGLFFLGLAGRAMYHGFWVDYSTPVPARVLEMERYYFKANPDRPPKVKYRFSYEYEFQGRRYVSERYSFRGDEGFHAYSRFRAGDKTMAWIDAERPERGVIERGLSALNFIWVGLGMLSMGGAALLQWGPAGAGIGEGRWERALAAVQKRAGPAIGMTIFFGGIGYFIWAMVRAWRAG